MIDKWWQKIPEKFPDIELGEYQIMPNHFHAIVINTGLVATDAHACPDKQLADEKPVISNEMHSDENADEHLDEHSGEHMGSPLHSLVQWFKTMSTNEYIRNVKQNGWPAFNGKLWQRNYYESIIRDEKSFQRIAQYIRNNPANWGKDKFFTK